MILATIRFGFDIVFPERGYLHPVHGYELFVPTKRMMLGGKGRYLTHIQGSFVSFMLLGLSVSGTSEFIVYPICRYTHLLTHVCWDWKHSIAMEKQASSALSPLNQP